MHAHCSPYPVAAAVVIALLVSACHSRPGQEHSDPAVAADIPTLQPAALAARLSAPGDKPLLFHVGFRKLYQQAHIPGSEFFGPTSEAEVVERLRQRATPEPRDREIVIYCGCCPWSRCPNVKPAYAALHELGFTRLKVLYIDDDFGADWADKGYPVAKGD